MIPSAAVLGLYMLPDKTGLFYVRKLQTHIPYADMLGLCKFQDKTVCKLQDKTVCKLQDKTVLCYTHYIMQRLHIAISFSVLETTKENISVDLLEIHRDYTKTTVHRNAHIYIFWGNMIRN
jgi:hypothetical protein